MAELSSGFWRYLLIRSCDRSLWPRLRRAWPSRQLRRDVHDPLAQLHDLRNRVAHHEPVFERPLKELHAATLDVAEWMCQDTAAWIRSRCGVLIVLDQRPVTLPSPQ